MAEHKDCKHYDGCGYRNDIGCCPNWCAQFKHKDNVRVVRCNNCKKRYNPNKCPMCILVYGEQHDFTQENGYCDRGEGRTDD